MLTIQEHNDIHREFEEIIRRAFGAVVRFDGGGSQNEKYFRADLSINNWNYRDTPYYYNKPLKFFHLTSLSSLLSIINNRAFRLYDLNSSTDPQEYFYAANAMRLSKEQIENKKARLHTLSFCPFEEINNSYVWEKYAKKGASIVFEIINDPKAWINFHMAEVKYELPLSLKGYKVELNKFEKSRNIRATVDPSRLIGFYKKNKFAGEREVRLLCDSPYPHHTEYLKLLKPDYRIARNRNRLTNYIELPLWVDDKNLYDNSPDDPLLDRRQNLPSNYFDNKPMIKIVDILFWEKCVLSYEEFQSLRDEIERLIIANYGYSINVSREHFRIGN